MCVCLHVCIYIYIHVIIVEESGRITETGHQPSVNCDVLAVSLSFDLTPFVTTA